MTADQPNLLAASVRIYVDDLDAALPFYRELTGEEPVVFGFRDLRVAKVGLFLLIEGADEEVRSHVGTIAVRDIDQVARSVESGGGTLLEGPSAGPNGPRLIARHPDGSVLEYIQLS